MAACCGCGVPGGANPKDTRHCRSLTSTARKAQCCRCAAVPGKDCCLPCLEQLLKQAAGHEKQAALKTKRSASEALAKTDADLYAAGEEIDALKSGLTKMREEIKGLEKGKEMVGNLKVAQAALESSITVAKSELGKKEKKMKDLREQMEVLTANKKRRKTEEVEAARTLEAVESVLSPARRKSHPDYWRLDCGADDAPAPEYPEVEPASLMFFQKLVKTCSHDGDGGGANDCNLSYLREAPVLRAFRFENKLRWDVYAAKRRLLSSRLRGSPGPAIHPPLRTIGVHEFLQEEKRDLNAGEVFLFHGVSCQGAAFEIADKGFNLHLARSGNMFGSGCYLTDDFCKSAFYAMLAAQNLKQDQQVGVVLVCRVCLGHPFVVPSGQTSEREATRAPRKCDCDTPGCKCGEYHDSVVAQTNVRNGKTQHGLHREVVVYDTDMVYPEFLLVLGPVSAASGGAGQGASSALPAPSQQAGGAQHVTRDVKAIVVEMNNNKSSASIQAKGCTSLRDLAGQSDVNRVKIAEVGGIEAVVAGMKEHVKMVKLQEAGCGALRYLARNVENKVSIATAGGIEAVIAGMKKHVKMAGVQVDGCWALRTLANNADIWPTIVRQGGVGVVTVAVKEHAVLSELGKRLLEKLQTAQM